MWLVDGGLRGTVEYPERLDPDSRLRAPVLGLPLSRPPMRITTAVGLAVLAVAPLAHAQQVQYRSLTGVEFRAQPDTGGVARAEVALKGDPKNVQLILALGLAQAAIRQYREAIATFSRGIKIDPTNALLYRWRGHRYISTGQVTKALADLERGDRKSVV